MTTHSKRYLIPDWPAPAAVHALVTTRDCGNLAMHVNDDPAAVIANRQQLQQDLALSQPPLWIEQVHGVNAINLDCLASTLEGDAAYTQTPQRICAVLTADCLPLLITSRDGLHIAAVHAGWRGLLAGVIDSTVRALPVSAADLLVWLGPAIGPDHFEVGAEVRDQFITRHADYAAGFFLGENGKWFADIYQLAKINLRHLAVEEDQVYGGGLCTYCDAERFYSYRRDNGVTGRMASLIWLEKN